MSGNAITSLSLWRHLFACTVGLHTEPQTERQNVVKSLYPPSLLHYNWRGLSKIEKIIMLFQK